MPARGDKGKRLLDDDGPAAPSSPDRVSAVQAQVDTVTNTMRENVTVMVSNMERTSQLEDSTAQLATQARAFHQTSRQTRKHFWWQLCKQRILIIGLFVALLLIITFIILSQTAWKDDDKK